MSAGFIRLRRSATLEQLVLDRNAWSLLGVIAVRARFHDGPNLYNLEIGEALVGDYKAAKLTREEYRGALKRLERKWFQIITRPTSRGTIAKLTKSAVFDFSQPQPTQNTHKKQPSEFIGETREKQSANNHPTTSQQPVTNNERRKERNNDDGKTWGNSILGKQVSSPASSFWVFERYQNHIKWPEYAGWCKKQTNGSPTAKGFNTWLSKQKPYWRNKKSPRQEITEESGYTLDGKFYTSAEANNLAEKEPNLIEKFRRATRRNGRILTNAAEALLEESERKADIESGCASVDGSSPRRSV